MCHSIEFLKIINSSSFVALQLFKRHQIDAVYPNQLYIDLQVDSDTPAFPRSTAFWWLGCSSAPRGTVGGNARLAQSSTDDDDDVGDIQFDAGRRGPDVASPVT